MYLNERDFAALAPLRAACDDALVGVLVVLVSLIVLHAMSNVRCARTTIGW